MEIARTYGNGAKELMIFLLNRRRINRDGSIRMEGYLRRPQRIATLFVCDKGEKRGTRIRHGLHSLAVYHNNWLGLCASLRLIYT
uniref:Uncharacterized protein n=1 Tax=Arundo donax TaxID=35708 RepID=A0A0A8YIT9_ARUDO